MAELKEKDKEIAALREQIAKLRLDGLFDNAETVEGIKIISASFTGTGADTIRAMCDRTKDTLPAGVAVIAGINDGKITFAAACGKEAVAKGAHAGNLVREIAKIAGGSGGGRPDSAMAGGSDVTKVDEALAAVKDVLLSQINK